MSQHTITKTFTPAEHAIVSAVLRAVQENLTEDGEGGYREQYDNWALALNATEYRALRSACGKM